MVNKRFVTKEHEHFCKDCSAWILLHGTEMGAKIYGCKIGLKPRGTKRGLACRYKKKGEE